MGASNDFSTGEVDFLFGNNLVKRRDEIGMSAYELAKRVNVSPAMICLIEKNRKMPGVYLAKDIADALECKLDDLFKEE